MSFNFDDDRDISQLLSALDKSRDQCSASEKKFSKLTASIRQTAIQEGYQSAGGRSEVAPDGSSFFKLAEKHIDKFVRTNDEGRTEVLDRNGIRRYSSKDASKPMSLIEYFDELKTHPVLKSCFNHTTESPQVEPIATPKANPNWQGLSGAERLTRLRQQAQQDQK